jgi:hypothetical protein
MENQQLLTDSLTEEVTEIYQDETQDVDDSNQEESSQNPENVLDTLINKRTGFFPIKLNEEDLKWIKNACKSDKFSFTGPNEAFMIMNCFLGFSSALSRLEEETNSNSEKSEAVMVQASAIEAAAILLSKYSGSGLDSAQRVFRIAVALNDSVMEMKQLDQVINQLKLEQAKQDEMNQA